MKVSSNTMPPDVTIEHTHDGRLFARLVENVTKVTGDSENGEVFDDGGIIQNENIAIIFNAFAPFILLSRFVYLASDTGVMLHVYQ